MVLNVMSWNVNGLNGAIKRTKSCDVHRFQNRYYKLVSFSSSDKKSKGVLILMARRLPLSIHCSRSDADGSQRLPFSQLAINPTLASIICSYRQLSFHLLKTLIYYPFFFQTTPQLHCVFSHFRFPLGVNVGGLTHLYLTTNIFYHSCAPP
uniref:Endonuclease/exonuclease/phosphatase domain-containing protein n=1 Tax=Sinocyclocheilus grahami TaxID=75366 RepID=A0A672KE23_SINGR